MMYFRNATDERNRKAIKSMHQHPIIDHVLGVTTDIGLRNWSLDTSKALRLYQYWYSLMYTQGPYWLAASEGCDVHGPETKVNQLRSFIFWKPASISLQKPFLLKGIHQIASTQGRVWKLIGILKLRVLANLVKVKTGKTSFVVILKIGVQRNWFVLRVEMATCHDCITINLTKRKIRNYQVGSPVCTDLPKR